MERLTKYKWPVVAAVALLAVIGSYVWPRLNSARRPEYVIRDELLIATPIGSSERFVLRYAKKSRFSRVEWSKGENAEGGKVLGCRYGSFQSVEWFPFTTLVDVRWDFDKEGKLTDIMVSRWVDAP